MVSEAINPRLVLGTVAYVLVTTMDVTLDKVFDRVSDGFMTCISQRLLDSLCQTHDDHPQ